MEQTVLLSIIVPAYNIENYIGRCLRSILSQTYNTLEIIVIDDGSTDGTGRIIDDYAKTDKRIVAIHQSNAGLIEVRELGIQRSNGVYIGFVDGDDAVEPDMFERLLKNALKYNADISHCGVKFCWPDGTQEMHYASGKTILQNNFEGQRDLLEGTQIEPGLWNKLYRKEILLNSCLDKTVLNNEDLLRNFIAFQRSQISVYEDFCGYLYMQRAGSMSKNAAKAIATEKHIFRARKLIVDNCDSEIFPYAMRTWISGVVNSVNNLTFSNTDEAQMYCTQCRRFLIEHRRDIHYLISRQKIAAILIMFSPYLHRMVYRLYNFRR